MGEPSRRTKLLKRVLPLLLVAGAATWFFQDAPQDRILVYDLSGRPGVTALRVDLRRADGALERHVEYRWSERSPAPSQQRQAVRLGAGSYRAEMVVETGPRTETVERTFTLDREEELTLRP